MKTFTRYIVSITINKYASIALILILIAGCLFLFPLVFSINNTRVIVQSPMLRSRNVSEITAYVMLMRENGSIVESLRQSTIDVIVISAGPLNITPTIKTGASGLWFLNLSITNVFNRENTKQSLMIQGDKYIGPIIYYEDDGIYICRINISSPRINSPRILFGIKAFGLSFDDSVYFKIIGLSLLFMGLAFLLLKKFRAGMGYSSAGWNMGLMLMPLTFISLFIIYVMLYGRPYDIVIWTPIHRVILGNPPVYVEDFVIKNDVFYIFSSLYSPFTTKTFTLLWLIVAVFAAFMPWISISEARLSLFEDIYIGSRKHLFVIKNTLSLLIVVSSICLAELLLLVILYPLLFMKYPEIVAALLISTTITLFLGTAFIQSISITINMLFKRSIISLFLIITVLFIVFSMAKIPGSSFLDLYIIFQIITNTIGKTLLGIPIDIPWKIWITSTSIVFLVLSSLILYTLSYFIYTRYEAN